MDIQMFKRKNRCFCLKLTAANSFSFNTFYSVGCRRLITPQLIVRQTQLTHELEKKSKKEKRRRMNRGNEERKEINIPFL